MVTYFSVCSCVLRGCPSLFLVMWLLRESGIIVVVTSFLFYGGEEKKKKKEKKDNSKREEFLCHYCDIVTFHAFSSLHKLIFQYATTNQQCTNGFSLSPSLFQKKKRTCSRRDWVPLTRHRNPQSRIIAGPNDQLGRNRSDVYTLIVVQQQRSYYEQRTYEPAVITFFNDVDDVPLTQV